MPRKSLEGGGIGEGRDRRVFMTATRGAPRPFAVAMAAVFGALTVIVVYQPGVMSADSLAQYRQAATGIYGDWHPPLMAYTWSLLLNVLPGQFGMLVWHQLLFWGGVALAVLSLRFGPWVSAGLVLAIGLFPAVFGLLGVIWKDVGMGAALALAVGLILFGRRRGSAWLLTAALLPLFYAFAMRYNAIPAVVPLVVWAVHELFRLRGLTSRARVAITSGGLVLTMLVVQLTVINSGVTTTRAWRGTATLQASLIHDLAGVAVRTGVLRFPQYVLSGEPPLTMDVLRPLYSPQNLNLIFFHENYADRMVTLDGEDVLELVRTWFVAVGSSPQAYAEHRLAVLATLFGVPGVFYPFHEGISANDQGFVFERSALYDIVVSGLRATQGLFFRGWIYLLAAALLMLTGIWRRRSRSAWIAVSGIAYVVPYALISAGSDFRYLWWLVVATVLATVVRLDEIRSGERAFVRAESGADTRI